MLQETENEIHRVLYISYGSNILQERLQVYLAGGSIAGNARVFPGARCPHPPRRSTSLRIPYELRFAREGKNWGSGGVCFLDVRARAPIRKHTYARGYDISLQQFNDIVRQENDHCAPEVPELCRERLKQLISAGQGTGILLTPGWYGYLVYLGDDPLGIPMLTFTCPPEEIDQNPRNPPSRAYFGVILNGLLQSGLDMRVSRHYLIARIFDVDEEEIDLESDRFRHYLEDFGAAEKP